MQLSKSAQSGKVDGGLPPPRFGRSQPPGPQRRRDRRNFAVPTIGAIAAFCAAVFTCLQWRTSVDTEKQSLRAYVAGFGEDGLQIRVGEPFRVWTEFRNSGQTPAFNVQICVFESVLDYPVRTPETWPPCPRKPGNTDIVIAPHNSIKRATGFQSLGQSDIDSLKSGRFRQYGYGTIYYTDAFGTDRFSNYCFSFTDVVDSLGRAETCDTHTNGN
jgi:hypothetical protein